MAERSHGQGLYNVVYQEKGDESPSKAYGGGSFDFLEEAKTRADSLFARGHSVKVYGPGKRAPIYQRKIKVSSTERRRASHQAMVKRGPSRPHQIGKRVV